MPVSLSFLKIVGVVLIAAVLGIALVLWGKVSKLEKEIESELRREEEE